MPSRDERLATCVTNSPLVSTVQYMRSPSDRICDDRQISSLLVDTMNRCFRAPLVESAKGGSAGGGAQLTKLGVEVLRRYRTMERRAMRGASADLAALKRLLRPAPGRR